MEKYIYYSIIIFSAFIILLYIYLLFVKFKEMYVLNRRSAFSKEINSFIEKLFEDIGNKYPEKEELDRLKEMVKNNIKRRLITEKVVYFTSIFKGSFLSNITTLCDEIGLVDYEIKRLTSKDVFAVALSCKNLGEFRNKKAVEPLLKQLNNKSIDVKYHTLMALSKIGNNEAFIKAFEQLESDDLLSDRSLIEIVDSFEGDKLELYSKILESSNVYSSIIFIKSSGNYMDAKLSEKISQYLDDDVKDRKVAAIKAIGQNADIRFFDKIINKLEDGDWEVRAAAAKSLGRMGDGRALEALRKSLSDSQWWVRYNAAQSIIKLPRGTDMIETVLCGGDKFAKDILISSLEDSGVINDIYHYEFSNDKRKIGLFNLVNNYILER